MVTRGFAKIGVKKKARGDVGPHSFYLSQTNWSTVFTTVSTNDRLFPGVEPLAPRVEGLAESPSAPAPEDEVKEEERRKFLKRQSMVGLPTCINFQETG